MGLLIGIILIILAYAANKYFAHLDRKRKIRFRYLSSLKEGDEITIRRFGEFQGTTVPCTIVRNIPSLNIMTVQHIHGIQCELTLHYSAKEFKQINK